MKRYLNLKTVHGIETVDELNLNNFKTQKEYRVELKRLTAEYRLCGMMVYVSSRAAKEWRNTK